MDPNSSIEQPDDLAPVDCHRRPDPEDQIWSFLPVIVASAAACLLMYFLMLPAFNAENAEVGTPVAQSARPGAATQTTPAKPEHGQQIGSAQP
jgi:hypothetical protein